VAAVTQTANKYTIAGHRNIVTAEFTSPTDGDTWDTGLREVDSVQITIKESSGAAADAIGVASVSGGTVTLDVQGTVSAALARAEGW